MAAALTVMVKCMVTNSVEIKMRGGGSRRRQRCKRGRGAKLFFLTHVDERAPAAAVAEERGKPARALRWIDPGTRWTHLDVVVCIATGTTHLCLALPVEFDHRIPIPRWHQTLMGTTTADTGGGEALDDI